MLEVRKFVLDSYFIYYPNNVAPAFFTIFFAASGLFHLWQCRHYKCFKLTWLFLICCLLFTIGFAMREVGAFKYQNLGIYIGSTFCIYLSPPLLELANYHILGRLLYYVPYNSPIHPGRVLTTFGFLSTLVEVFNAIGISYVANPNLPTKTHDTGNALMKVSLILQICVILAFYGLSLVFQQRCSRGGVLSPKVRGVLWTLYGSSFIILIRTIYRTVEYFGVQSLPADGDLTKLNPILRYEWYFWVFEACLMLINLVLWNLRHPRRYLPEDHRVFLERNGLTEVKGEGWDTGRKGWQGFLVSFIDPFGWFDRGKGQQSGQYSRENGTQLV